MTKSTRMMNSILWLFLLFLLGCQRNYDTVQQGNLRYNVADIFGAQAPAVALARAASRGAVQDINRLIASGVDINSIGKENITPLWWDGDTVRAELACPSLCERGYFTEFKERIILRGGDGDNSGVRVRQNGPDSGDLTFDIKVKRKQA